MYSNTVIRVMGQLWWQHSRVSKRSLSAITTCLQAHPRQLESDKHTPPKHMWTWTQIWSHWHVRTETNPYSTMNKMGLCDTKWKFNWHSAYIQCVFMVAHLINWWWRKQRIWNSVGTEMWGKMFLNTRGGKKEERNWIIQEEWQTWDQLCSLGFPPQWFFFPFLTHNTI